MQGFAEYARYLQHPLTLIGFAVFVVFGIHRALIRSGIIPPLTARSGSKVVHALLRYGFVIALAIIVLGFALEFFKTSHSGLTPEEVHKVTTGLNSWYLRAQHQQDYAWLNTMTDEDRQRASGSSRELQDLIAKGHIKLTPEELTGLGYLYVVTGELDKAQTARVDALNGNPSLGEAYGLLAGVYQLQASESLQRQDLGRAHEAISKAEESAKAARNYYKVNTALESQLGFIYKDMAQVELDNKDDSAAHDDLENAEEQFKGALGRKPNDPSAHNGMGSVYYLGGDFDRAIDEQRQAVGLAPGYTYAWHELAGALAAKYSRDQPPDAGTLRQLNSTLDTLFALQQTEGAIKLPPAHAQAMQKLQEWARAEAAKLPQPPAAAANFNISGVGRPAQVKAIKAALVQYHEYLRHVGIPVPDGKVEVRIVPANDQYVSYYDPSSETIYLTVSNADRTFWPLRDYTIRALGKDAGSRPQRIAILSGLATYYPSSSRDNPNYGPGYGGQLDQFHSLNDLQPNNAGAGGSSIWGSICWELRKMLGREAADTLLLQAWRQMPTAQPTQPDAVLFAATLIELHKSSGGTQADAIQRMFERRGLAVSGSVATR
jgi:tetratricopeptide (TPR) repeat protein